MTDPQRSRRIAVIPGDGIGPEVIGQALRVLSALDLPITTTSFPWSAEHWLATGETLPQGAAAMLAQQFDAILFGALGDPRVPDQVVARDVLLGLRFQLDLYINLRPIELLDDRLTPLRGKRCEDIRITVFRENTEGIYAGVGGTFRRGTPDEIAINEDINTRKGVERIQRAAFSFARDLGRRLGRPARLCMTDKSNAMPQAHGLWQRVFAELRAEYPDVAAQHLYIDVCAMEMVRAPERFDVIVTNNLFGDILTDLGAALCGGLGLAPSGNIHPGRCSLFEPVHGSAPDIAGRGVANPLGAILSLAMLLDHIGESRAAGRVRHAVTHVVRSGQTTPDLGGTLSTSACGDAVLAALSELR
ncbi:MAG: 3-isopropylmalate dehydrogenase [Myxococcales bacterium]|nr:3-isopropylmalate dehydrogenase [Myxococcota bacterium]MDW8281713.1 3-isopropylmalate dehydrogenase [Myxococcales bacterium]